MNDFFPIVITTHNRTNIAKYVLQKLIDNIKSTHKIFWIISDDASDNNHCNILENVLKCNNIVDYKILHTNEANTGLGASLNNGLKEAFTISNYCLRTEDDWVLCKEFNFDSYINDLITHNNIAGIRFGNRKYDGIKYNKRLVSQNVNRNARIFNNQVMLVHKRIYNKLGYYQENVDSDKSEGLMAKKFNDEYFYKYKVCAPSFLKCNFNNDTSIFIHVGKSELGHNFPISSIYNFLYDNNMQNITYKQIQFDELFNNSFVISIDSKRIDIFNKVFQYNKLPLPKEFQGFTNSDIKAIFVNANNQKVLSNAYKCSLSHAAIVKMAKCLKLPYILIFEDDAYPCINIRDEITKYIEHVPSNAGVLLLGWSYLKKQPIDIDDNFQILNYNHGSHAYILFENLYNKYLEFYQKNPKVPADIILTEITKNTNVYTYKTKKQLFIQHNLSPSNWNCIGYIYEEKLLQKRSFDAPFGFLNIQRILNPQIYENINLKPVDDILISELNNIDKFIYRINGGNIGDCVIAQAEYQLFSKLNLDYETLNKNNRRTLTSRPFNLVYGGGGGWIDIYKWNTDIQITNYFKNKNLKKCIILPSTFYNCDTLINLFDERFTVFCRDKRSYEYCLSKNNKAKFILHDDLVFSLDITNIDLTSLKQIQTKKIADKIKDCHDYVLATANEKIANFLRNDKEKTNVKINIKNLDLSALFGKNGEELTKQEIIDATQLFLYMINKYDTIITNRLHVAICSYKLNKNIQLYDNSYSKVFNTIKYSIPEYSKLQLNSVT